MSDHPQFSFRQSDWAHTNKSLEIDATEPIVGKVKSEKGGAWKYLTDEVDGAHEMMVNGLNNAYNETEIWEAKLRKEHIEREMCRPDLILSGEHCSHEKALEVKVSRSDMQRAWFQCADYFVQDMEPWLVVHIRLAKLVEDRLAPLYGNSRVSNPGILAVEGTKTVKIARPTY